MHEYKEKGEPHGYREGHWDNGNLAYRGVYHNGVKHGHWEIYKKDGLPLYKGEFRQGEPTGYWEFFSGGELENKHFHL